MVLLEIVESPKVAVQNQAELPALQAEHTAQLSPAVAYTKLVDSSMRACMQFAQLAGWAPEVAWSDV
jgi:hypothetical protein